MIAKERAFHGACAISANQMAVFGGATGGGALASDQLYMLDLKDGIKDASWPKIIIQAGKSPGRRYGHSVVFNDPFLILFGGIKEDR